MLKNMCTMINNIFPSHDATSIFVPFIHNIFAQFVNRTKHALIAVKNFCCNFNDIFPNGQIYSNFI